MNDDTPDLVTQADRAFLDGDTTRAEDLARQAVSEAEAADDTPALIKALSKLAFLLMSDHSRHDEYEATGRRVEDLQEAHARKQVAEIEGRHGADHPDLIKPLLDLAGVFGVRLSNRRHDMPHNTSELDSLYSVALKLHDRAESICKTAHGTRSEEYARCLMRRAGFLNSRTGKPQGTPDLIRQALDIFQSVDPKSKDTHMAKFNLASALRDADRLDEAAHEYEEMLADDSIEFQSPLRSLLASVYRDMGREEEALALERDVNEHDKNALGEKSYLRVPHLTGLADDLRRAGKLDEAESTLREAIDLQRTSPREGTFMLGLLKRDLASCLLDANRPGEAVDIARQALVDIESDLGPDHVHVAHALLTLAGCLKEADTEDEIEALVVKAAEIATKQPDGMLFRFRHVADYCLDFLGRLQQDELADRLRTRLDNLPEEWRPLRGSSE